MVNFKLLIPIAAAALLLVEAGASAQSPQQRQEAEIQGALRKISKVYDLAATRLADPVDAEHALFDGAIRGALSALDPFSTFLDAQQTQSLQAQQRGVQKGFGAVLSVQSGAVTVLQSVPGSPFARAGLGPGDRIVRINDHRVASMDLRELVEVLQAAKSDRVRLSVLQGGAVVPRDFDLSPTELPSPTVDKSFLIAPGTGYLHVAGEEESTPGEIKAALEQWKTTGLKGLILDLRDNPGGAVEPTVAAASLFLRQGQAVVSLQGRSVPEKQYVADAPALWSDIPLVVLINGRTASAAEILAAAFQDHDRAWVVGEPSFGKGVVESLMPLSEGAALALTTARYYTPQGRSVQRPLPGTALADILTGANRSFFSDGGRPLHQGGGVAPDQEAASWKLDGWAEALGQSTAFMNFAQLYIERHGKVGESFEVNDSVLAEFESFLRSAGAVIPAESWFRSLPYLKVRIKAEMFDLVFGAAKGDEVETEGDPQVKSAVQALGQAQQLLQIKDLNQNQGTSRAALVVR